MHCRAGSSNVEHSDFFQEMCIHQHTCCILYVCVFLQERVCVWRNFPLGKTMKQNIKLNISNESSSASFRYLDSFCWYTNLFGLQPLDAQTHTQIHTHALLWKSSQESCHISSVFPQPVMKQVEKESPTLLCAKGYCNMWCPHPPTPPPSSPVLTAWVNLCICVCTVLYVCPHMCGL